MSPDLSRTLLVAVALASSLAVCAGRESWAEDAKRLAEKIEDACNRARTRSALALYSLDSTAEKSVDLGITLASEIGVWSAAASPARETSTAPPWPTRCTSPPCAGS